MIASGFLTGTYDATNAAKTAYKTKNPEVLGAELLGQKKIRRVLDLHFCRSEVESLLADVRCLLKRSSPRGANLHRMVPAWKRVATALESLAEDNANG